MSLWEMSIYGACLILVISILRAFTIYRLPKRTFLVLWGIALLRLLVPLSVPSAFSIYTLVGEKVVVPELPGIGGNAAASELSEDGTQADGFSGYVEAEGDTSLGAAVGGGGLPGQVESGENTGLGAATGGGDLPGQVESKGNTGLGAAVGGGGLPGDVESEAIVEPGAPAGTGPVHAVSQPQMPKILSESDAQTVAAAPERIWFIGWLVGFVLLSVFFIVSYLRCRSRFRFSVPAENDYVEAWRREHPLRRKVEVRQTDKISSPLTYGVLRPVILMPGRTDWNDEKQLEYILMHEFVHICRFDTLLKLVAAAALCVHWFNPLVWAMYLLFNRDIELACDESVVRQFGMESRAVYSRVLIGMEEQQSGLMPFCNNFSKNAIEERIVAIMKTKKITICSLVLACVLVAGTATVFATSAMREPNSKTAGDEQEMPDLKTADSGQETQETELADHGQGKQETELADHGQGKQETGLAEAGGMTANSEAGSDAGQGQEADTVSYQSLSEADYTIWDSRPSGSPGVVMRMLTGDPALSYMEKYIFKSVDGGKSWQDGYSITDSVHNYPTDMLFVNENVGFILTDYHAYDEYLYRTADGGKTWTAQAFPDLESEGYRYIRGVVFLCDRKSITLDLVGVKEDGEVADGIFVTSDDEGCSWYVAGKGNYIPNFMQPYSVVLYDVNCNRYIAQGGELTREEIRNREDIASLGMVCGFAEPNTKVTYDRHGFVQNVYYLEPGTDSEYHLSPPEARTEPKADEPETIPEGAETFVFIWPTTGERIEYWFQEDRTCRIKNGRRQYVWLPLAQNHMTVEDRIAAGELRADEVGSGAETGKKGADELTPEERAMKNWTDAEILAYVDAYWAEHGERLAKLGLKRE